jgi:hypothetical protein
MGIGRGTTEPSVNSKRAMNSFTEHEELYMTQNKSTRAINIIFSGPPSPTPGLFVEVEDDEGRSIRCGEWLERDDGLWSLRISELPPEEHTHVYNPDSTGDDCLRCGLGLRNPVHIRACV